MYILQMERQFYTQVSPSSLIIMTRELSRFGYDQLFVATSFGHSWISMTVLKVWPRKADRTQIVMALLSFLVIWRWRHVTKILIEMHPSIKRESEPSPKWWGGFKNEYCDLPPHFVILHGHSFLFSSSSKAPLNW